MTRFVRPLAAVAGLALVFAATAHGDGEKEILKTPARFAAVTPDGKTLIAAGNKNLRVVDLAAKKSRILQKAEHPFVMSGNGKLLAAIDQTLDEDAVVTLYDVATAKATTNFVVSAKGNLAQALSPDGKVYLCGGLKELYVWDVATKKNVAALTDLPGQPFGLAVSPDGKAVAVGYGSFETKAVATWDLGTMKPGRAFPGVSLVQAVAFSPDGKTLAASSNGTITLWEFATGKERTALKDAKGAILYNLAFGNAGKVLAAGSRDGVVTVWDTATGKVVTSIPVSDQAVFGISLSADGKVMSAADEGGQTRVYDLSAVVK